MPPALCLLGLVLLGLPLLFVLLHTLIRIVRHIHKFPIPQSFANLIDNPLRRRIQPPDETVARHGIGPGMTVLEVGPGNGTYTMAAARAVGDRGRIVTIDVEPKMIERVKSRAEAEGIYNIEARVANVYCLPYEDGSFDLVTMIAVIGEIPEPARAMREFHRVLSPTGRLAFSELLLDPDYPRAKTLVQLAQDASFHLVNHQGNLFLYTLQFAKNSQAAIG